MGLEVATFIQSLDANNPTTSDKKKQGDDHLRLLKEVLKSTFPNADHAFYFPRNVVKAASFAPIASDVNTTFLVSTAGGIVVITLPTLTSGDAGWECSFIKTTFDTTPMMIQPATGTLQSGELAGLVQTRRCIPGKKTTALWTGTSWILTRAVGVPVGAHIDYEGAALPPGYEWPEGSVLLAASYPDYVLAKGGTLSATRFDMKGRVGVGRDDMGGVAALRITAAISGVLGTTLGASGGGEGQILLTIHLPSHKHTGTTGAENQAFSHQFSYNTQGFNIVAGTAWFPVVSISGPGLSNTVNTGIQSNNHTHSFLSDATGSDTAHPNVQPMVVVNKLLVVE